MKDILISFILGTIIGALASAFIILSIWDRPSHAIVDAARNVEHANTRSHRKIVVNTPNKNKKTENVSLKVKSETLLLGFEDARDLKFFALNDGLYVERTKEIASQGSFSLFAEFPQGAAYPGLFWEVYNKSKLLDWSGYSDFAFDVYNNSAQGVNIVVKFKSGANYPKKTAEFNYNLAPQQWTHVVVPMGKLSQSLDVSKISYIKVFVPGPGSTIELFFDNFRLNIKKNAFRFPSLIKNAYAMPVLPFSAKVLPSVYKVRPNLSFIKNHLPLEDELVLKLAKAESESFQLLVFKARKDISFSLEFEMPHGITIEPHVVNFVETKRPYYPVSYVGKWPDPLIDLDLSKPIDISMGQMKLFWFDVFASPSIQPGKYEGKIHIVIPNADDYIIPIHITIWNFRISDRPLLKTAFDVYDSFFPKFFTRHRGEDYPLWKARIGKIKHQLNILMLKYKMSPMLKIDPVRPDFREFIRPYVENGLNNFAVGSRYGGSFGNNWPQKKEDMQKVAMMYADFQASLESAGLLDMAYVYAWDEGRIGDKRPKWVMDILKQSAPKLKLMVCYHGLWDPMRFPNWADSIDIWCYQIANYDEALAKKWIDSGRELWMYVSGPDGKTPNFVIDSLGVEPRIASLVAFKRGAGGMLYWAVNFWQSDPWDDTMNTPWHQNGNGMLFYPYKDKVLPSIRCSLIRDGIEDYEYWSILRRLYNEGRFSEKEKVLVEKLLSLRGIVNNERQWSKNPQDLLDARNSVGELINAVFSSQNTD